MEVPGKLDERALCAEDSTLLCLSCDIDGLKEPAYGYCQDCQEHLCETCYKHHRRARPFKNHVLIDKESMPKIQAIVPSISEDTADVCKNHQDKLLEFYCRDHKLVTCYLCVTLEHKQCKVDYIPGISENLSDEINDLIEQMESLMSKCKSNIENVGKAAQNLEQSHAKVIKDIKIFRKEINECLDKMEHQILKEAKVFVSAAKYKQETIKYACLEISEKLECFISLLNTLRDENKRNKLFIEMKKAGKHLTTLRDKEKQILHANTTEDCITFTRNANIIDWLKTDNNYGTLLTSVKPSQNRAIDLQYICTLNIKSQSDENDGHITGIVMISSSRMIVADRVNRDIKLINVGEKSMITQITMSSPPFDVIMLPGNKLAVTLRDEKCIQILSYTDSELSLDRRLAVREKCNGIAYCQDRIVVCCRASRKIIIINFEGDVLNVLGSPLLFYGPVRVLISHDEKFLYVSDTDFRQNSKVVKIDWAGNIKKVFEETQHAFPYGLQQLEDETILVCFKEKLVRLSNNLKVCEIVDHKETNLCMPTALTYDDKEHKLYFNCSSKTGNQLPFDTVQVFKVMFV